MIESHLSMTATVSKPDFDLTQILNGVTIMAPSPFVLNEDKYFLFCSTENTDEFLSSKVLQDFKIKVDEIFA